MREGQGCFAPLFTLAVALLLVPQPSVAQGGDQAQMRTPDDHPDISGIFTFRTLTPFERPRQFEGREPDARGGGRVRGLRAHAAEP